MHLPGGLCQFTKSLKPIYTYPPLHSYPVPGDALGRSCLLYLDKHRVLSDLFQINPSSSRIITSEISKYNGQIATFDSTVIRLLLDDH